LAGGVIVVGSGYVHPYFFSGGILLDELSSFTEMEELEDDTEGKLSAVDDEEKSMATELLDSALLPVEEEIPGWLALLLTSKLAVLLLAIFVEVAEEMEVRVLKLLLDRASMVLLLLDWMGNSVLLL
jgi:hypothetical protein